MAGRHGATTHPETPRYEKHSAALSAAAESEVTLSRRGLDRLRSGHVWVYRSDVRAPAALKGGEVVRLVDERGWFAGKAFYGKQSQISVRLLTREDEATDARRELLADVLQQVWKPRAIVERNDVKVRAHEGLPLRKGLLRGAEPGPVEFLEGEVRLIADLLEGQKTGAFLDQAENRIEAGRYARGRALDCFTYGGAFALHLSRRAESVTAVDISERAAEEGRRNAALNGATNVTFQVANAFDLLRDQADEGQVYDTIVLDPPAFAKNKASLAAALRGYKEINLRAFHLLSPGGVLVTASCSFHIDEAAFERTVLGAAADAGRSVQVIERRGAARDHPTLLGVPETRYLKCLILRAL